MGDIPVLEFANLNFPALTEFELDSAIGYARLCYEQTLDRDLLRILVNTTHSRRQPKVILAMLAAMVVKENIQLPWRATPEQVEDYQWKVKACKAAIMKTMSIRRVWKQHQEAQKRARGEPVKRKPKPKQTEHPVEVKPSQEGQGRLFS